MCPAFSFLSQTVILSFFPKQTMHLSASTKSPHAHSPFQHTVVALHLTLTSQGEVGGEHLLQLAEDIVQVRVQLSDGRRVVAVFVLCRARQRRMSPGAL